MKRIPLYDASAPIACTLTDAERPARIAQVERLRANLTRLERTEHGMLLHFPARPDVEADLQQFAVDEKRCCQFWGFAVDHDDDGVALRWDGPPASGELIDRLVDYFEGDAPLSDISALL